MSTGSIPDGDPSPSPRLEREVYLQERRDLIQSEGEQTQSYDKSILTLSGGALGLSLTLIKEVVPTFAPCTAWLLYSGWACFVLSLLVTLTSFQLSIVAIRRQREILDAEHSAATTRGQRNTPADFTAFLNWSSLVLFVAGAAALTLFVAINFHQVQGAQP
jgi:hypothetical protein